MHGIETLETDRLVLRAVAESDLPEFIEMHADLRVMKTLGGLQDAEKVQDGMRHAKDHWRTHGFGPWTIRRRTDSRFLGRCALRHVEIDGANEVEIGWAVRADDQRLGYATEAARQLLPIAFETLQLPDLVSFTLPFNVASRRVMEKLGFEYEKDCWYKKLPHVLYRCLRPAQRGELLP
jgi:ribosomal-protein-alanine N-acetyltransferase